MACLLVLVVAAAVLTAPPGKLAQAARTTSPEAFWRAALPNAPMPESVRELLRHGAGMHAEVKPPSADDLKPRDDDPPPMNFNYDDYRASSSISPRDQAVTTANAVEHAVPTAKAVEHAGGARNAATEDDAGDIARASPTAAAVFFLEDAVRVGGSLPFPRAAPEDQQAPLELRTVRAVRAVQGSSFVLCRGGAPCSATDGGHAVYGCRGVAGPARAYVVDVAGERGDAVTTAAVVCRADDGASKSKLGHAALRLLDAKPGGGVAACYAVPDAQVLLVKSSKVPSSG